MSGEAVVPEFRPPGDIIRGGGEDMVGHHVDYKSQNYRNTWVNTDVVGNLDFRLLAFVIIAIVAIVIIVILLEDVMDQHKQYSLDTGGPLPETLIIGSAISLLAISIAVYTQYIREKHDITLFWMYMSYVIFLLLWFFNFAIRIDLHNENKKHEGNGFIFIFISTIFLLSSIYFLRRNSIGLLLAMFAVIWNLFLTYHWVFS